MEIVIGTTNPAKLRQCRFALRPSSLRVRPLTELLDRPPQVPEDSLDAEENALRKARAYCGIVEMPVLSLDYALLFDDVPASLQPGVNVRRIPGVEGRPTDHAVLDYYSALVAGHGGRLRGRWAAGAAVATPAGRVERATIAVHRTFVAQPSRARVEGYPLASLQLAEEGRYISELSRREVEQLWERILGKPLRDLVVRALEAPEVPGSISSR